MEKFDVLSVCCVQVLLCGMLGRWSHRLGLSPHTFTSSSAQPSSIGTSTHGMDGGWEGGGSGFDAFTNFF